MPECGICAYAAEHGSWPHDHKGTHCADTMEFTGLNLGCHRSWSGSTEAHCVVCHQHFTSEGVATLHEPYCTEDRTEAPERLRVATTKAGSPVFGTSQRRDGEVWVRHDPRSLESLRARVPVAA